MNPETQNLILDSIINGVALVFFWFVIKSYVKGIEARFDKLIEEIKNLDDTISAGQVFTGRLEERVKTAYARIISLEKKVDKLEDRIIQLEKGNDGK